MKIVIDIPFEWLFDMKNKKFCQTDFLYQKILNGIPLPKGHGRLIDADDLEHITICSKTRNSGITRIEAPTIIEADKAESEG